MEIEQMSDFFTARVDGYDEHLINDVKDVNTAMLKWQNYCRKVR